MTIYWILLGLNAIPFLYWQSLTLNKDNQGRRKFMDRAAVSLATWEQGRYETLLTSAFTHTGLAHFGFNMFTMYTFCRILSGVPALTGAHVVAISIGSAVAGSLGYIMLQGQLAYNSSNPRRFGARIQPAIGASGMVMGIAGVATCFFPRSQMLVFPIPFPIPLWAVTIGFVIVDAYYLDSSTSRTAHAGHLGGLAFGVLYYALGLRRLAPFHSGISRAFGQWRWR